MTQSRHTRKRMKQSSSQARGVEALRQLLTGLACVLLPRGMTPKRFSDLARYAFVQAAADISKLRNGRVNHSRVAAQTGLTRADVKRLLKESIHDTTAHNEAPLEKVIYGWRTDREFFTREGHPKRLRISGSRDSFARLVRKHGGDVPHRAVLEELRRIRAVTESGGMVQLRPSGSLRERQNFAFLLPVVPTLIDGLTVASTRPGSNVSSIRRIALPADTEADLAILRDRCAASTQSMLDGLALSLGTQVTVPQRRNRSPGHWLTISVLLAEDRAKRLHHVR
jgi:uncharacterized protein DUF6502